MLKRVFGTSNGLEINFTKSDDGKWITTIPRDLSGIYYLELYAEDDAGNISYMATVVMKFDPVSFCVKFDVVEFHGNAEMKEFIETFHVKNNYDTKFKGGDNGCCC